MFKCTNLATATPPLSLMMRPVANKFFLWHRVKRLTCDQIFWAVCHEKWTERCCWFETIQNLQYRGVLFSWYIQESTTVVLVLKIIFSYIFLSIFFRCCSIENEWNVFTQLKCLNFRVCTEPWRHSPDVPHSVNWLPMVAQLNAGIIRWETRLITTRDATFWKNALPSFISRSRISVAQPY